MVSKFYDEMINFDKALKRRLSFFKKFSFTGSALDLGCGSGLDSISLAKLGLTVSACDHSNEMIQKAKINAEKYSAEINFMNIPLQDAQKFQPEKFDLIVSMGNTLANLDSAALKLLLTKLPGIMSNKARLVFQLVNFDAIVIENEYELNTFENDKVLIKRYYKKSGNKIFFKIDFWEKATNFKETISTEIFHHSKEYFAEQLNKLGIVAKFYGGIDLREFIPGQSKDLIIVA